MSKTLIKVTPERLIDMRSRLLKNMDQLMRLANEQNVLLQQLSGDYIENEFIAQYCTEAQISMTHLRENLYAAEKLADVINHILELFPPSPSLAISLKDYKGII